MPSLLSLPPNPTFHPSRSSQSNKLSSLCCAAGSVSFFPSLLPIRCSVSVQSLSCARLFATPWTAARQASLSITSSQSLLKLLSVESVMSSNRLILRCPLLLLPSVCILLPLGAQGCFLEPQRLCSACAHSRQKLLGN